MLHFLRSVVVTRHASTLSQSSFDPNIASLRDAHAMLLRTLNGASGNDAQVTLDQFLRGPAWQKKISEWAQVGVFQTSNENDKPYPNMFSILTKRDENNLPSLVKISFSGVNAVVDVSKKNYASENKDSSSSASAVRRAFK